MLHDATNVSPRANDVKCSFRGICYSFLMRSEKTRKRLPHITITKRALNAEIGQRIRIARVRADMDQKTLAKAVGYASATAIHMMEIGAKKIQAADLAEIAYFLNCTIRSFFPKGSAR